VGGVAEVEAFFLMTAGVEQGVGADGDRQRLRRGFRRVGLPFRRQHLRDVELERDVEGVAAAPGRADLHRDAAARARQVDIGGIGHALARAHGHAGRGGCEQDQNEREA
jgi:hypothetical protein